MRSSYEELGMELVGVVRGSGEGGGVGRVWESGAIS